MPDGKRAQPACGIRPRARAGAPGRLVPVAPVGFNQMLTDYLKADQTFAVCPNQDVAYGAEVTELDKELTLLQVPDFGSELDTGARRLLRRRSRSGRTSTTPRSRTEK